MKRSAHNMLGPTLVLVCIAIAGFTSSCSVISADVRSQSATNVPYRTLVERAHNYQGQTVILGGYILEIKNTGAETIIKVLQTPLRLGDEPKSRDQSEGRFIVYHDGFLDPEVYSKDRAITVAGKITGSEMEKLGESRIQYLKIETLEIYLWPDERYPYPYDRYRYYPYPYYWYHPWYFPYPYGYW